MDGTFMNPDLVEGIKDAESPVLMKTNAGTRAIDKVAEVNGFGEVYFDEGQMANIFGFAAMVDKADRVFYDSSIEDALLYIRVARLLNSRELLKDCMHIYQERSIKMLLSSAMK